SLDHVAILGPGLGDIAAEKAGIVKPGSTLVLGETDPVLAAVFRRAGAAEVWERGSAFGCENNRLAHGGRLLDLRTACAYYPAEMLEALDPSHIVLVVASPPPSPRALPPAEVASAAANLGLAAEATGSVAEGVALARARAGPDDMLLVTGSLYTVGAARSVLV